MDPPSCDGCEGVDVAAERRAEGAALVQLGKGAAKGAIRGISEMAVAAVQPPLSLDPKYTMESTEAAMSVADQVFPDVSMFEEVVGSVLASLASSSVGVALEAVEGAVSSAARGTEALATRAGEVHGALHPVAQRMRTTAVLETSGGRVVAGGGPDLTPAQRALLGPGESAARLPGAHAEVTALTHAQQAGVTPQAMAVTRTICPQCAAAIEASRGTVTSPTTAVWPR
jgi:hypothetical protein